VRLRDATVVRLRATASARLRPAATAGLLSMSAMAITMESGTTTAH